MLATGDWANKTTIYDVKTKAKIQEFKHDESIFSVAFSNDLTFDKLATVFTANKILHDI